MVAHGQYQNILDIRAIKQLAQTGAKILYVLPFLITLAIGFIIFKIQDYLRESTT